MDTLLNPIERTGIRASQYVLADLRKDFQFYLAAKVVIGRGFRKEDFLPLC